MRQQAPDEQSWACSLGISVIKTLHYIYVYNLEHLAVVNARRLAQELATER